jgi:single-strand DNA-binding protein
MSNSFGGKGNLGDTPVLKTVTVNGEERRVAEMRVFFDDYKKLSDGVYEQREDSLGFVSVSIWDERAETAARLLRKGARVKVEGSVKRKTWVDKTTGESRTEIRVDAEEIFPVMSRIESIRFKAKQAEAQPAESVAAAD